ncbi:MAG: acyl carrier protein [Planctomycetes bacterium]|nr:acyl carrier protein [Planctomycetota bacterium]MCH8252043.1 acyl carrier protein [Planctomycetota bacterium]
MVDFESARREILDWAADTLQVDADALDLNKPLSEIGLDSLDAVHMIATIEGIIQQELPEDIIQRVGTLDGIFEMMRQKLAAA